MKLAAAVILYHPDETLWDNILTYIDHVGALLIYDNTPDDNAKTLFEKSPKIRYYWDGENEGIAKRLNTAIEYCKKEGFEYLLTMDQDSSFESGDMNKYISRIENLKLPDVGMYGILHHTSQCSNKINEFNVNQLLITSGSIIPVNAISILGNFNENLFIDGVDTEFCLRIFEKGFKTILFQDITLKHQLGSTLRRITPSLKYRDRTIHTPFRVYYITRNFFYLRKKYRNQLPYLRYSIFLNELKNGILYGNERLKFLSCFMAGYLDYRNNNMGKRCV